MTSVISPPQSTEVFYPSSDGEPLAETSVHIDAIINAVVALRQYLSGQQAIVLADQFLYYAQGYPKLRVAPDVMVIFDVTPGPRDNYKTWEEGQVPVVIFEMTSAGTKDQDQTLKRTLYEQLEVQEYWLFDPRGEWIPEKLRGYRLRNERYEPITDSRSQPLQLRLQVEEQLIGFYREDTGEKLPTPNELVQALQREIAARQQMEQELEQERQRAEQEHQRAEQERQRAEQAESQVAQLQERLRALGIDPDS
ncbi:MAG: Uma2 family endonuclease [Leptolyngbyaceae cyanobacterium RU_5_1]|nr:Uma2 family endonuclease [Leptolyngbyaceae cyanobacterium RU_5_1]